MQAPRECHLQSTLRILEYVKVAPGKGLIFQKNGHLRVKAYSDASYADDKGDHKSTSSFCTFVGGNLVSWKSKKQYVVSRCSAEAEYRSMTSTTCELKWLRALMMDLGEVYNYPLPMFCDNKAAIYISKNPVFHERTKHIEVDCHFIREEILRNKFALPSSLLIKSWLTSSPSQYPPCFFIFATSWA
ncbi:hypothetical protein KSP39_PZI004748 [Platanthera zijinensis]|uniref:Copia protein n=1 Tax=Platanthera zijinensis TaxID=2320716 RepID=A0AAP0GCM1_9ASPA